MRLYMMTNEYAETIESALRLQGEYNQSVVFHCFWNGSLNEKHLFSILSCYYFNVHKNKHKIVLWLENNAPNEYNEQISKYAELRHFSLVGEKNELPFLKNYEANFDYISFYSDLVRYLLLYNYGGVWFDLDCFFLRSFDPIFCHFEKEICVYAWGNEYYPNNAVYISLEPKSEKMKTIIEFIFERKQGWGFQEANLTYDLNIDLLVFPSSWFNGCWIPNDYSIDNSQIFECAKKEYDFETFFKGGFCYHWHNQWDNAVHEKSALKQLFNIISDDLAKQSKA